MYNTKKQGYGASTSSYGSSHSHSYCSRKSKCPHGAKLGAKMSMCGIACTNACMVSDN